MCCNWDARIEITRIRLQWIQLYFFVGEIFFFLFFFIIIPFSFIFEVRLIFSFFFSSLSFLWNSNSDMLYNRCDLNLFG